MDLSQYEQIAFSEKRTNRSVTKYGYKVGEWLVVSYVPPGQYEGCQWRVYRSQDGLAAIDTSFATSKDAVRFAEWLKSIYEEYFWIWSEYPKAELYRWTYLTIENGEEYWKYLTELKTQRGIKWTGYNSNGRPR
jgi:hypothetical protein